MQNKYTKDVFLSAFKFMRPLTIEATYGLITTEVKRLLNADYVSIFLLQDDVLKRVYSTVPSESQVEPRKDGFTVKCYKSRKAFVVSAKEFRKQHPEFKDKKVQQIALIPLVHDDGAVGVLSCQLRDSQRFSHNKFQMLQLFGSLASLKIANNTLISDLKDALSTRDLFISMASHELKTPLTTISAYAQLINRNISQEKPVSSKWSETLVFATKRLEHLISELLQVSQIKTGKLRFDCKEISFNEEVLPRAVEDFKVAYPEHTLVTDTAACTDDSIMADTEKLLQVLTNLLNNAAKFSPSDKEILLICRNEGEMLHVEVRDQGPGISSEDLGSLFEEFYRAKNNPTNGMGLGLFISKKIMLEHSGEIYITSQFGQGTQVHFKLPVFIKA
ncbi:MAG: GAF domain-containing sensor histidine kinase [bacterium]|nr:GAF domain-containing sensor histidine kinase [bacterium]